MKLKEAKLSPAGYGNQTAYMRDCVPVQIEEGDSQAQAVAVCLSRWRSGKSLDGPPEYEKGGEQKMFAQSIEIKELNPHTGEFAGWASVFDTEDAGGDTVRRGAFIASLEKRMPKIYLEHETSVGMLALAEERDKGLWVEGQPDESSDGLNARAKLKSGALDALSIGFRTLTQKETGRFKRDLLEIDLYHVGIVAFGMHEEALVTSVKSLDGVTDIRALEKILRDAGFSRKAAQRLCSPGYIANLTQGDPDDDAAQLVASLQAGTNALRR